MAKKKESKNNFRLFVLGTLTGYLIAVAAFSLPSIISATSAPTTITVEKMDWGGYDIFSDGQGMVVSVEGKGFNVYNKLVYYTLQPGKTYCVNTEKNFFSFNEKIVDVYGLGECK